MTKLKEGDKAPRFEGTDQNGNLVNSDQYKGKKLVLYFYPKDNTPGCTSEACNLRDNYNDFIEKGFEVVGVSADSEKSHKKFAEKHDLPFPLIADTERKIMTDYGTFGEKKMYGKTFLGINRATFIISEEGVIEKIFKKVDTKQHTEQIFKSLQV
ncbi:MAG: thioredoxin-dependent thiol peroxidase [Bacteroidales bacterium]|nr:thioredoxin-dependent thiol peroxidase [Bacteroidales bacterium]